jgi:hypothetical protein
MNRPSTFVIWMKDDPFTHDSTLIAVAIGDLPQHQNSPYVRDGSCMPLFRFLSTAAGVV